MHAKIHRELPYRVISIYPKKELLEFLLLAMVHPKWREKLKKRENRIEWLKEWMDTPDDSKHGSTLRNDHSYKLKKEGDKFKLVFGKSGQEQATVVARLKYDARDIKEWMVEDEPRVCALELAMCMHWVVDVTSPSHCYADCDQDLHGKIETAFDKFYPAEWPAIESQIKFAGRKDVIKDVYRWAMASVQSRYDQNEAVVKAFRDEKTFKDPAVATLGRAVLKDIGQNVADFLVFVDGRINFEKAYESLKEQSALLK